VMAAFGSDGIRAGEAVGLDELSAWMLRGYPQRSGFITAARPVGGPLREAVQLLEHCELICLLWITNDAPVWTVTRLGTSTLAAGKDAVRQRIRDRSGL